MATIDQMNDDEKEFAAAFNEDQAPVATPSEDEEFGLTEPAAEVPPEPAEGDGMDVASEDAGNASDGEDAAVALVVDGQELEQAVQQSQAKDSAEAAADAASSDEKVAVATEDVGPAMDTAKEIQRLKSWEGRLKAMEAKLKAAGASTDDEQAEAVSEAIEKAADATDTPADEEKVEQIAEMVEEGDLSVQQAMKQLAEDFGDEFVKMIEAIATAKAREAGMQAVGEIKGTVDEIINDIVDTKARSHFEAIADKHPTSRKLATASSSRPTSSPCRKTRRAGPSRSSPAAAPSRSSSCWTPSRHKCPPPRARS